MCNTTTNDEPSFISEFKKIHNILISLVDSKISIYHKLAIFLFLSANQLTKFNLEEQTDVITKCKTLLLPYLNHTTVFNPNVEIKSFENYVQPIEGVNSNQSIIANGISKYKNTDTPPTNDFNVLEWRYDRKNDYRLLCKLSCRIFTIPASSAPSERIFSIARALNKRPKRGSNGKSFNKLLFVNVNSKNYFFNLILISILFVFQGLKFIYVISSCLS